MAYTTINKSSSFQNTTLYTGNSTAGHAITGVNHQPDLVWIKNRSGSYWHNLLDSPRGVTKFLYSALDSAEGTGTSYLASFDTDGFTVNADGDVNNNGNDIVGWTWKGGTTSGLSGGDITPSSYSINTTSKFGIYKYTGNGSSGATITHGLGAIPRLIIVKRLDTTGDWQVLGNGIGQPGATSYGKLNSKDGFASNSNRWNNTGPTTSEFSLGNSAEVNASGGTYVAYIWCNVPGYFKGALYQGNGNANGTFVYTGGRPTLILLRPNIANKDWYLIDYKRGYNGDMKSFYPNANAAETALGSTGIDIYSNGFKIKTTDTSFNGWGNSYQYWCWMQTAVGSNNVPCTAR